MHINAHDDVARCNQDFPKRPKRYAKLINNVSLPKCRTRTNHDAPGLPRKDILGVFRVVHDDIVVVTGVVMACVFVNGLVVVTVGPRIGGAIFGTAVGFNVVVSRHPPSHPCFTHEVSSKSDVSVGLAFFCEVVGGSVVVSRQPPNHPYLTHDVVGRSVVDMVDVEELVVLVELVVVVSSRHPTEISCMPETMQSREIHTPPSRRFASGSPCGKCG